MLSISELDGRKKFYAKRLGEDWVNRQISNRSALWSESRYDEKIKKVRRLGGNVISFATYNNIFSGMSSKNYIPILRECKRRDLKPTPNLVNSIYSDGSYKKFLKLK